LKPISELARVARFSLVQKYQIGKKYQITLINTKWPQNIPPSSITRPSKIYPNWDFWSEKIASSMPKTGLKQFRKNMNVAFLKVKNCVPMKFSFHVVIEVSSWLQPSQS
jgi:hypothetical protein